MHMRPDITEETQWMEIDDEHGETHFVKIEDFVLDDWFNGGEVTLRGKLGFGARMSAPGYMDCTDWVVFEKEEDAAEYLADNHFDEPLEEMSQEELNCLHDLVEIMGDEETEERIAVLLGLNDFDEKEEEFQRQDNPLR